MEMSPSEYHLCGVYLYHLGEWAIFHQTLIINSENAGGTFRWEPNLPLAISTNQQNLMTCTSQPRRDLFTDPPLSSHCQTQYLPRSQSHKANSKPLAFSFPKDSQLPNCLLAMKNLSTLQPWPDCLSFMWSSKKHIRVPARPRRALVVSEAYTPPIITPHHLHPESALLCRRSGSSWQTWENSLIL